jgi:hypothetical protein
MWLPVLALSLMGGVLFWRGDVVHWIEPHPGQVGDGEKSSDLTGDLRLMWETQKLGGTPDPTHGSNPRASTDRAINAASRVFNTVELVGKTRDDVVAQLGDPKTSSDSIYNFPFWRAPKGSLVYRFDCGAYGWQFNVVLGADGRVREVERHWIH